MVLDFKFDKAFWRNARLLFWSFIVAFVALDIFNLIDPMTLWDNPMALVYIVAGWVVAYHGLQKLR